MPVRSAGNVRLLIDEFNFAGSTTGFTFAAPTLVLEANNLESTADLPAMYPRLPSGTGAVSTFTADLELDTATCDLVILVQPLTQASNAVNYAAALSLMDNLHAALATNALALGLTSWEIRAVEEWVSDTAGMWMVVATVRASG